MKPAFFLLNIALASCILTASAHGSSITWASGVSGNWSNPTNWNPNQVPGPADTAFITASGNYTVTVDTSITVGGLVLGSGDATTQSVYLYGQSLAIGQSATVNTNGVIIMGGGTLNFDPFGGSTMTGTLTCSGGTLGGVLTIASNGVVNLFGISAGTQTVDFAALTLTNFGTIVWSNIDLQCQSEGGTNDSQIFNFNSWEIQSDNTFTGAVFTAFNNYGTVRKNIGTYAPPNYITRFSTTTFNNSGTVDVEMGAMTFSGGSGGGLFNTATNAGIGLGNFTLTGDATFTGPGAVQGTLYGQNGIIHGSMPFDYGSLSGTLTVATDGVLNLVGIRGETTPIALNGLTLTNYGAVVWSNLDIECQSASTIDNYGLWDSQTNNTFHGPTIGNPTVFNNYGTVQKDGGTWNQQNPLTLFDNMVTFNNSGTINVEVGGISLSNGNGAGLFDTAANAGLSLGTFTLTGDATFVGPGAVQGTLYGQNGIIHGALPFDYGSLSGTLTVAPDGVLNLTGINGETMPIFLNSLALTNYGTVISSNLDIECQSASTIDNYGLWDIQTNNTFHGPSVGNPTVFNNYGTVRKDGGAWIVYLQSPVALFDSMVTFNNSGTIDAETGGISLSNGSGGGVFNTASGAGILLGNFTLAGDTTFTGPGQIQGNMYGFNSVIHGSLNLSDGALSGMLTVATNSVVNLLWAGSTVPIGLDYLTLTNYGTVIWGNFDLDCSSAQVDNFGLWDVQSDKTFYGNAGGSPYISTFNNYGTVRKDGGSGITTFDNATTFNNYGTVDAETAEINIDSGNGGGLFNTVSNAILSLGSSGSFTLSGITTFTGPGQVQGNLYGFNGVIHGSLNLSVGSLSGMLTIASNNVVNLLWLGSTVPIGLDYLTLTNYGTVIWGNFDLDCSSAQVDNFGLWDVQSDRTFYGDSSGSPYISTFNNYGTVRKDGGSSITTFDNSTTFNNSGTVDVETAQININSGNGGGLFNTASNGIVWLGNSGSFNLSGITTFTGPGLVGGNLYGNFTSGIIQGSLNFYYGSLGGCLTVASNAVVNLLLDLGGSNSPNNLNTSISLNELSLTNCGTVVWNNVDLDCTSAQIDNHGLWDAVSDNTFHGDSSGSPYISTFNNYGTVRKAGGSTITTFDASTTFNNSGTVDVETAQINIDMGSGGGVFNTASNAIVWLGASESFNLSGITTFSGPGLVGGNLYGDNTSGVIQGSLNFYYGSLGGYLTIASNAVANLLQDDGDSNSPINLNELSLTNCGTVVWNNVDLDCTSAQIYNHGLWDAVSDNTFYGDSSGSPYISTFNNYGTVRKDGGSAITTFDISTTFNNPGKTDVQVGQVTLAGSCSLTNGTLNFGIDGPSQFGVIDFPNYVQLAGQLSANFRNHYTPVVSNSFPVVAYTSEIGTFTSVSLPGLSGGLFWQTNYTGTAFTLNVAAAGPLQLSAKLSAGGNAMSFSWYGLLGQTYQVQCATNLFPAIWVNFGGPITGTNGPVAVLDSLTASPQKFYRIQLQ